MKCEIATGSTERGYAYFASVNTIRFCLKEIYLKMVFIAVGIVIGATHFSDRFA